VVSTNNDILEMERVRQYLNVFSIYREEVSKLSIDDFSYPHELPDYLHDTLKGATLTRYSYPGMWDTSLFNTQPSSGTAADDVSITYAHLSDSLLYIRILSFNESTAEELAAIESDAHAVCIDLRGNPGGRIDACTTLVEQFLPADRHYITVTYQTYDAERRTARSFINFPWRSKRSGDTWENRHCALLTNDSTASAAEIFASALHDKGTALHIGTASSTYGKALGQYLRVLDSGALLQITGFSFKGVTGTDTLYMRTGLIPDTVITDQAVMRNDSLLLERVVTMMQEHFSFSAGVLKIPTATSSSSRPAGTPKTACHTEGAVWFLTDSESPNL